MPDPHGGIPKRTSAERAELRHQAYQLYAQHKTNREIGEILGVSGEMARQYVLQAIKETSLPDREEDIKRTLVLLAQNLVIAEAKYKETKSLSDYQVIDKILHMRAKFLGTYSPDRVEATVTQRSELDASISNLLSQMEAVDVVEQRPIESEVE